MGTALHKDLPFSELHKSHSLEFADATARNAFAATADDIGRIARQLDTGDFYLLLDDGPLTWDQIGSSAASPPNAHAATHQHGGSDEIAMAIAAANAIPKALASGKLGLDWMPQATLQSFKFQPGGVASGNVYTDWATLYAALNASNGARIVDIDDSLGAVSIPVGTYNFQDVVLRGPWNVASRAVMTVPEGVVFQKLRRIEGFLTIDFTGTTAPVSDWSGTDIVTLRPGVIIQASGAGPFFYNNQAGPATIMGIFMFGGQLVNAGYEVAELDNATGFGFIGTDNNGLLSSNALRGILGSLYQIQVTDNASNVSWIHTNHAGLILPNYPWSQTKSGVIDASAFAGSPTDMQASVVFSRPYIDDQYHISLSWESVNNTVFTPSVLSRVATGFTITLNSTVKTDLTRVTWSVPSRYSDAN